MSGPQREFRFLTSEELEHLNTDELHELLESVDERANMASSQGEVIKLLRLKGRLTLTLASRPKRSENPLEEFEEEIDVFVGNRVRMARAHARMTQRRLADAIGISEYQVSRVECGSRPLSVAELIRLSIEVEKPVTFFTKPRG